MSGESSFSKLSNVCELNYFIFSRQKKRNGHQSPQLQMQQTKGKTIQLFKTINQTERKMIQL